MKNTMFVVGIVLVCTLGLSYSLYSIITDFPNDIKKEIFKNPNIAYTLTLRGDSLLSAGNFEKSIKTYKKGLEIHTFNKNPHQILFLCERIGVAQQEAKLWDEALMTFNFYQRLAKLAMAANPNERAFINGLALSYFRIGEVYLSKKQYPEALAKMLVYNDIKKQLYAQNSQDPAEKHGLSTSYFYLADAYSEVKKWDAASKTLQECIKLLLELRTDFPDNWYYKYDLAVACAYFAEVHIEEKDKKQAIYYAEEAKQLLTELIRDMPDYAYFEHSLADVEESLKVAKALK